MSMTREQFTDALSAGKYAWPGGYETHFVMADGETICFDCADKERETISETIKNGFADDWQPVAVLMSPHQPTIGHEPLNGSGTMGDDQYKGRERYMRARFKVDSLDRYGIDSVFGLSGSMWSNHMNVRLSNA